MRRQILLASVGAIAIAGSAFAADLPYRGPPPVYLPPVPIFTWSGLYIGGQIGYAWGKDNVDVTDNPIANVVSLSESPKGVIGGAHLGYNLQIAQWVVGLEGSVDGTSMHSSFTPAGFFSTVQFSDRVAVEGSIRARAGIAFNRVLLYATGGAAFAGIDNTYLLLPPAFAAGTSEKVTKTRAGWTVGGGIAYAVTNNWSVRAEYRYSDYGRYNDFPFQGEVPGGLIARHHLTENQVQAGVSYKFDSLVPPVVAKY
jgi:outer membrane immunogenic protein